MAFLLRLIDAPDVRTPQDASDFLERERGKAPAPNPKFASFREAITQTYPDLSDDDEDGDNDDNVWEEGLSDKASSGHVKSIALKEDLTDEALVAAIARAASANGLHCYDDEGQALYRADGLAVDTKGRTRPF